MDDYIKRTEALDAICDACNNYGDASNCASCLMVKDVRDNIPAADVAPVLHGEPIIKRRTFGGFRQYTGVDAMGETHTITVDERHECNARHCPECQALLCSRFDNYCPRCGTKIDRREET